MRRYRNNRKTGNNSLLMRLLGYALNTFIIPFVILLMRLLAYVIVTFVIPFVIKRIRKKVGDQQRLSCNKCHGKLQIVDKGNFYCKNCKIIKFDPD